MYQCHARGYKDTWGYGIEHPRWKTPPKHANRCPHCGFEQAGSANWWEPGVCQKCGKYKPRQASPASSRKPRRPSSSQRKPARQSGKPCDGLVENTRWSYGVTSGDAKAFLLSAPLDKGEYSQTITELHEGQFFVFRFKVVQVQKGGSRDKAVEILNRPNKPSGWVLRFAAGKDTMIGGLLRLNGEYVYQKKLDVSWYLPGAWNKVRLEYCRDGGLRAALNGSLLGRTVTRNSGGIPITTRAVGTDVAFDG
jgi:hypothetical protein